MLKLNASYSKKVPSDEKFSSKSFMACVEVELPSGQTEPQIRKKIHETFELVKASVEDEIAQQTNTPARQQGRPKRRTEASTEKATNKQIQFILKLGQEQQKGLPDLNAMADEQFKAPTIYDLTKRDASKMVDQLKMAA